VQRADQPADVALLDPKVVEDPASGGIGDQSEAVYAE
jgi:hypothetical protein